MFFLNDVPRVLHVKLQSNFLFKKNVFFEKKQKPELNYQKDIGNNFCIIRFFFSKVNIFKTTSIFDVFIMFNNPKFLQ